MATNTYYQDNNKLNTQIAVAKNNKTVLEFLDRLKFEDNSAQVESAYSRIRIGIQDFSSGKDSIYKWDNLTPEQCRTAYDSLCNLDTATSTATEEEVIRDLGELYRLMELNPGTEPEELDFISKKIDKYKEKIEEKKKPIFLLEEKKILPYDNFKNPNNCNEHLITGCKIYYNPAMRIPIIFEVSQGYGKAIRDNVGRVQYSGEHDTITVKKMLSVADAKSLLRKVVSFCDNMAKIATDKYYELKVSGYGEET